VLAIIFFGINKFPKTVALTRAGYVSVAEASFFTPVLANVDDSKEGVFFFNQSQFRSLEAPELKIIQNDCLAAFSTPRVLSPKVLGAIFGQGPQIRKEVVEYEIKAGDTFKSIAASYDISLDTLLLANDLTKSSKVKVGQKLIILPVTGLVHIVKSGDTLTAIAKLYKANVDEVVETNDLSDELDVYVGDILVVPNGTMPKKAPVYAQAYLPDSYFSFPVQGRITQTLHWYNGVDIANECGTPVYASARGVVLKAKLDTITGGGNVITIRHDNGVVSWYGHLETMLVKVGDVVGPGDRIGSVGGKPGMAGAGISTGCHLHFTIIGAKNPFAKLPFGYQMKYVSS